MASPFSSLRTHFNFRLLIINSESLAGVFELGKKSHHSCKSLEEELGGEATGIAEVFLVLAQLSSLIHVALAGFSRL